MKMSVNRESIGKKRIFGPCLVGFSVHYPSLCDVNDTVPRFSFPYV